MEHYVTLFDSLFLPQGLTLHESLEKHSGEYTLWIICMDEKAFEVLTVLDLSNVKLLNLTDIETDRLRNVRQTRSAGEYCWTLTPFSPGFVFDADKGISRVTYLDADLWFRKNPKPFFLEFENSGKDVMITEHSYAPEFDQSAKTGRFCVQFMVFNRSGSDIIRKWWEDRCIEWCYARFEEGKYGDQKYLDDWDERFAASVHILVNQGWCLAPWNAIRFPYSSGIFFHFHGLRLLKSGNILIDGYPLPESLIRNIYRPYIESFRKNIRRLRSVGFVQQAQGKRPDILRVIKRMFNGIKLQIWKFSIRRTIR